MLEVLDLLDALTYLLGLQPYALMANSFSDYIKQQQKKRNKIY